jgi:hypothetical protein
MALVRLRFLIPASGTPSMAYLSFFFGVFRRPRKTFNGHALLLAKFSPCFESTFFAARATFSVTHIKLFFHDKLSYLLETFSSCNLAIRDAGKQVASAGINVTDGWMTINVSN